MNKKIIDIIDDFKEQIEYVIYVRRSRDEEDKQRASIPQQIEDCLKSYEQREIKLKKRPLNLEIDEQTLNEIEDDNKANPEKAEELKEFYKKYYIITERGSAKTPYDRKKWRELINQVKEGKIDGIYGYSPDRLSRNLLEAGELLDLYGTNQADLKFSQISSENTATGHMLLGMLFIQSTFYSKKLGEDVTRGASKKHLEGYALGHEKYGYIINEDQRYEPHPVTFKLLREAFDKKLYENWSDNKIVEYLNEKGWNQFKNGYGTTKLSKQRFSDNEIWKDTFYYGIHKKNFNNKEIAIDLRDLNIPNYQFKPLITEEEHLLLQEKLVSEKNIKIKRSVSLKTQKNNDIKPIPIGAIKFEPTGAQMLHMLPNPKRFEKKALELKKELWQVVKPHQIKYRYMGTGDTRKPVTQSYDEIDKRIKKIFEKVNIDPKDFEEYKKNKIQTQNKEKQENKIEIQRFRMHLNKMKSEYEQFIKKTNYGQNLESDHKTIWQKEDHTYRQKITNLTKEINEKQKDRKNNLDKEEIFLELLQIIPKLWEKASYVQKRQILEVTGLNISVKKEGGFKINLKPEIESFFCLDVRLGGRTRTHFEHLSNFVKNCDSRLWGQIEGLYEWFTLKDSKY